MFFRFWYKKKYYCYFAYLMVIKINVTLLILRFFMVREKLNNTFWNHARQMFRITDLTSGI